MSDLIDRQAAIEWCLEGLNNMPSSQPERWVPCSERFVGDSDDNPEDVGVHVIAWMPLPEAYREGEGC